MASLQLDATSTIATAANLQAQLSELVSSKDDSTIEIDASMVERFDYSLYQLLYSAKLTINDAGGQLKVVEPSECFLRGAQVLGVEQQLIS